MFRRRLSRIDGESVTAVPRSPIDLVVGHFEQANPLRVNDSSGSLRRNSMDFPLGLHTEKVRKRENGLGGSATYQR